MLVKYNIRTYHTDSTCNLVKGEINLINNLVSTSTIICKEYISWIQELQKQQEISLSVLMTTLSYELFIKYKQFLNLSQHIESFSLCFMFYHLFHPLQK